MAHPKTIPMDAVGESGQPAIAQDADGRPSVRVYRRNWDADKRKAAALLDMVEPFWAIYYGPGSRLFFAIAAWNVADPLTPIDSRSVSAVWP